MTHLSEEQIISLVRRTLNEAQINESEFYTGADETEIDNIIKSRILECLRFVNSTADPSLLDTDKVVTECAGLEERGTYRKAVILVPDFLRLKSIRVAGWSKALSEAQYDDEPSYQMQQDKYACGTPANPQAYICEREGEKTLELYCLPSADSSVRVEYMAYPQAVAEDDGGVDVSDRLQEAYTYYLSFLTLTVLNDQHADDFLNLSMSLMGAQPKQEGGGA